MKTLKGKEKLSKQLFNVGFRKKKKESGRGGGGKKKPLNLKPYKIKAKMLFRQAPFPCISKIFMNSTAMVLYARCNHRLLCRAEIIEKCTVTLHASWKIHEICIARRYLLL